MALVVGTVAIDGAGVATGSGLSLALYNSVIAPMLARSPALTNLQDVKVGMAEFCGSIADGLVAYLTTNAAVTVTIHTTDSALQRTPNPNNPDTATQGPASDKTLSGTVA